jgi:hypothetical protein
MNKTFTECRELTAAICAKTGTLVGIAVEQGKFAVTSTAKEGHKSVTKQLTGWQSHAECVVHMRQLAA